MKIKGMLYNVIFLLMFSLAGFCNQEQAFFNEDSRILLKNVNLIDGRNNVIRKNIVIIIENGIIQNMYSGKVKECDAGIKTINCRGDYVIPGLIEAHSHLTGRKESNLEIALRHGITSIRDMGGDGEYLLDLKHRVENEELMSPDIYFSAIIGGPDFILNDARARISTPVKYVLGEAPWARAVDESSNIEQVVKDAKACRATGVKLYADLSKDLLGKIVREAREQGLMVWGHAFIGPTNVLEFVQQKPDVISHITSLLYPPDWEIKTHGSLGVDRNIINTDYFKNTLDEIKRNGIIVDATLSIFSSMTKSKPDIMQMTCQVTRMVYDRGIPLVTGTDNLLIDKQTAYPNLFHEIQMMADWVGIPAMDVIKSATIYGAKAIGIDKTHGSVEIGKVANLVVLDKNPLRKIENINTSKIVIKNGKIIKNEK